MCPSWHAEELKQHHIKVVAAQLKDRETLRQSSSGGIFSLLAEYVLHKGGIVFGAAFDENLQCHHIGVSKIEDLKLLRGSKYVHSEIGKTFTEAQSYLRQGKWVYFTGTPCQIVGLKLFLRKDYPTLLTSDLICHGTPSQKVFNRFVKGMEQDVKEKIVDWNFRDKSIAGWACSSSSSSVDKRGMKHRHILNKNMTSYFNAFLGGYLFRMDCYKCPFACPDRVSDITLADYWGVKKFHVFETLHFGVSLVIINNKKGMNIWEMLKDKTTYVISNMEYALQTSNRNLRQSSVMPEGRKNAYWSAFSNFDAFRDSFLDNYNPFLFYKSYYKRKIKWSPIGFFLIRLLNKHRK